MEILIGKNKNFYKANLHCHSTQSDGKIDTEKLKAEYKKRGYSVVAFTDHEHIIDNSHLNDENFLTITSCELAIKEFPEQSTLKNLGMCVCHLNFYALDPHNTVTPCYSSIYDHFINDRIRSKIMYEGEYERIYTVDGINDMIRIGREKGFLVSFNHPNWSLARAADYMNYEGLWAVEIYNNSCAIAGHTDDEHAFDDILRTEKQIFCTAADDNHNKYGFSEKCDSFGGFVMINADELKYESIMHALQAGDFYASTGPAEELLTRNDNTVRIRTSPAKEIYMLTRGRKIERVVANEGELLTEASFSLGENDGYFRIRVVDGDGKKAYTQAYKV